MKYWLVLIIIFFSTSIPVSFARVTPNDIYQEKRAAYEAQLSKISDTAKREKLIQAEKLLNDANMKVISRFEEDVAKMAAVLEELKFRIGAEGASTIVAYGQGETQLDSAAYWLNYAAEAVAYQKIQDYTPSIGNEANLGSSVTTSVNRLSGDLGGLRSKIIKARGELSKIVANYEK